jgi:DnaJ-class molecular chaperone
MANKTFFAVRCGPCCGTGRYDDNALCRVCRNQGIIYLSGSAHDYIDCANCAGSGFTGFNFHTICVRCEGIGALKKQPRTATVKAKPTKSA